MNESIVCLNESVVMIRWYLAGLLHDQCHMLFWFHPSHGAGGREGFDGFQHSWSSTVETLITPWYLPSICGGTH